MKTTKIIMATLLSLPTLATIEYSNLNNDSLYLGQSLDYQNPLDLKEDCLVSKKGQWVSNSEGVFQTSLVSRFVKTRRDLARLLKRDYKFSAHAKFSGINATVNAFNNIVENFTGYDDSLSYLIQARYNFDSKHLSDPELKPKYQDLLNNGEHEEFIKRCGTHFAVRANYFVEVNGLITMSEVEKKNMDEHKAHLDAGIKSEIAGGEIQFDYSKKIDEIFKQNKTEIKVETFGGGSESVKKFAEAKDLSTFREGMNALLGEVKRDNAVATKFTLVSMERFGLEIPQYTQVVDDFLVEAYLKTIDHEYLLDRIQDEIDKLGVVNRDEVHALYREFKMAEQEVYKRLTYFNYAVRECREKGECALQKLNVAPIRIKWLSNPIQEIEGTGLCLGTAKDTFRFEVKGMALSQELVDSMTVTRILNGVSEVVNQNGLQYLNFDPEGKYFLGTLETAHRLAINPYLDDLEYQIKVVDIFGREYFYQLRPDFSVTNDTNSCL